MQQKISKKDFEILHWIEHMCFNNPKQLSEQVEISKQKAEKKLIQFEKRGLIKIEYREGKIYGSQLTDKGKQIWEDDKYLNWKLELGF